MVILVDNGSLRPEAHLALRATAAELAARVGQPVVPASLLHSSRIPAEELGGQPALTWERAVKAAWQEGERDFVVLPYFFGPTGAIVEYMPQRLAALAERLGPFRHRVADFLYRPGEGDLPAILADHVRQTIQRHQLARPPVVLVDHGSPRAEVTAVRNALALALARELGDAVAAAVAPASMERRDDPAYDFCEPLLERQLRQPGFNAGPVVVAMLFLSPGRHAGPGGDVDTICRTAEAAQPGLQCHLTPLVGQHPGVIDLLARRLEEVLAAPTPGVAAGA